MGKWIVGVMVLYGAAGIAEVFEYVAKHGVFDNNALFVSAGVSIVCTVSIFLLVREELRQ